MDHSCWVRATMFPTGASMVISMRQQSFSTQQGQPPAQQLKCLVTLIISCMDVVVIYLLVWIFQVIKSS